MTSDNGVDPVTREIGKKIRDMRERRGWSLSDLEAKCDVTKSYIAKIERGEVPRPGVRILSRLAGGLDIPLSALVEDGAFDEGPNSPSFVLDNASRVLSEYPDLKTAIARLRTDLEQEDVRFIVDAINLIAAKRNRA